MPEQRGREHQRQRVAETLREEIAILIEGELSDPRIGSANVTEVVLEPGGRSGHVYVAVEGGDEAEQSTLAGLLAARGYIRSELHDRTGKRRIPDLTFHIDKSERLSARVDTLLTRADRYARKKSGTGQP